jgi:UDP-3-O-[3-hydroxymyristoyl] glucosamine N-acyltransferase
VGSQSGIINQIKGENAKWLGFPAIELTKMIRAYSIIKNLPELEKRLSSLEKAFASNQTEEK